MTGLLPGTTPAQAPASCTGCRRRRGGLYPRALLALRLARICVLAARALARRAAVAGFTALARSRRLGRVVLAAASAFGTGADRARTDIRLSGHEKLLFVVSTSCQQRNGVSHPGGEPGLDGAAIVLE